MIKREETLATKKFGQYRVLLVRALGGPQVRITDTKACGRIVVIFEAISDGIACFDSITADTVETMVKACYHAKEAEEAKRQLALAAGHYIYGTLDWIEAKEIFNPIAAREPST